MLLVVPTRLEQEREKMPIELAPARSNANRVVRRQRLTRYPGRGFSAWVGSTMGISPCISYLPTYPGPLKETRTVQEEVACHPKVIDASRWIFFLGGENTRTSETRVAFRRVSWDVSMSARLQYPVPEINSLAKPQRCLLVPILSTQRGE